MGEDDKAVGLGRNTEKALQAQGLDADLVEVVDGRVHHGVSPRDAAREPPSQHGWRDSAPRSLFHRFHSLERKNANLVSPSRRRRKPMVDAGTIERLRA